MSSNVIRQPVSSRSLSGTPASPGQFSNVGRGRVPVSSISTRPSLRSKMQEIFNSAQGSIMATLPALDGQRSPDVIVTVRCRSPDYERLLHPAVTEPTRLEHDDGGHHRANLSRPLLRLFTKGTFETNQRLGEDRIKDVHGKLSRGWKGLDTDLGPTEDASSDSWTDDEIFCVEHPPELQQPLTDRISHLSRVNIEYLPVSPDLTSPHQQDDRNWKCQPRVHTRPRWELQANGQSSQSSRDESDNRSLRFRSYYPGSISVRQVPGEYEPFSPIMVMHSESSSSSTSRKTSLESCTGMSARVDTEPMSSILESPEKAVVQSDSITNASTEPGEGTTSFSSISLHSTEYHVPSSSHLSSTVPSRRSSLSGSPAAPWSPVSPHFQESPRQHAALQQAQHRASTSEEQYLDEAHIPLLATHLREGPEESAALLAFRPITPMAREELHDMDDTETEDGQLTPLSPKVKIERGTWQHRDTNIASRSARADSGYENESSLGRKRCGSNWNDEVLEKMGASPGKKRDAVYESG
ncbi:hypothetical protein BDV97DRAFT_402414 [Delphinella strobiligena]|nr:hypothetical protein BDV97DRAFT_402414 [Delphinella strobiligena]